MKRALALALVVVTLGACAAPRVTPGTLADVSPPARPAADTDEAGLWMMSDRLEREVATSGALVHDPALNAYVRGVVCRLVPAQCAQIRIYVVETPYYNASMAPNGALQVWTGLLLRVDSEAELAYVLGHEIGHFQRRHTVQLWRDLRAKANAALVFSVLTAGAGVGVLGILGQLAALGSALAFSRDNEREADEIGFDLMTRAGYDPREAAHLWEALEAERRAAEKTRPFVFFASHPATDERVGTLRALAARTAADGGALERERLVAATSPHRALWLQDELRLREFKGTQVVLDRLRAGGARPGEIAYFQGELYRLRGGKDDAAKAVAAYDALAAGDAPAEAHRALGLVWMTGGDRQRARAAFERYLEARPEAEDRAIVRAYLGTLQ